MASSRLAGGVGDSSAGRQLTKWQTALLIGVPLTALSLAGIALFLYLRRRSRRLIEIEVDEDRIATPVLPEDRTVDGKTGNAEDRAEDGEVDEPPELVRCTL